MSDEVRVQFEMEATIFGERDNRDKKAGCFWPCPSHAMIADSGTMLPGLSQVTNL